MVQALHISDAIQEVVSDALAQVGQAEAVTPNGLETFAALRHEFPEATIVTLSLSDILAAVHKSVYGLDE
jgi:hypothetical protein